MKKLTEEKINSIRAQLKFDGRSKAEIARLTNVDPKSVYRIAKNLAHKNVPYPTPVEFEGYRFYPGNKVFSTTKNKWLKTKNGKVKLVNSKGERETVNVKSIINNELIFV